MEIANTGQAKRRRVANQESSRFVGPDRLSNLPEDVILHILSYLPTEETIPTSTLARDWKPLWKKMRHLKFDSIHHKNRFSDHVISALISYQNRVFESLTITVADDFDTTELAIWIGIALIKNVSKLVLRLNQLGQPVTFPERSLERTNTLKILKLIGNITFDLPVDSVSLNWLKEMHLYHVSFQNEVSLESLLGRCPKLEELVLELFLSSGIETVTIDFPSLRRLTLASHHCIKENIVLRTPSLELLKTKKLVGFDSFMIETASKITDATITHHEEDMDENILSEMNSVQRLSLTAPLKYPTGLIFDDLISLEIQTKPGAWCILLSYMLTYSPKLQFLKLVGRQYPHPVRTWIEPAVTAKCMLTHLHTVVWEEYTWDDADDRDVATYILKHGAVLKDVAFTILEPGEYTNMNNRQEMLAQLSSVQRASPSCNLLFKASPQLNPHLIRSQDPDIDSIIV